MNKEREILFMANVDPGRFAHFYPQTDKSNKKVADKVQVNSSSNSLSRHAKVNHRESKSSWSIKELLNSFWNAANTDVNLFPPTSHTKAFEVCYNIVKNYTDR